MNSEQQNLDHQVKEANRSFYNKKSVEVYNRNKSLFNDKTIARCRHHLQLAVKQAGNNNFLDVATGTGYLTYIADDFFEKVYSVDIAEELLRKIKPEFPQVDFAAADAGKLPFKDGSFGVIGGNALLHHLYRHEDFFAECFRILKAGGVLYTDHDPNYFLNRYYYFVKRIFPLMRPQFSSEEENLAEYHNYYSPGINPEKLKKILLAIGFRTVQVDYWVTDRTDLGFCKNTVVRFLRLFSKLLPLKSFYTHFSIYAVK